jgi:hypothetical protein
VRHLRALGLARASLVLALGVSTVVFAVMAYEGYRGQVAGALLVELALIVFIQQGLTRLERIGFSLAAVSLALLAVVVGSLAAGV